MCAQITAYIIVHLLRNFENLCRSIQIDTCISIHSSGACLFHVCMCLCVVSLVFFISVNRFYLLFVFSLQASGGIPLSNVDTNIYKCEFKMGNNL